MKSIWNLQNNKENIKSLEEDIKRDIVIIGGGIAGILCGYKLAKEGKNVTLIEADTLCSGTTQYTTAHIESLQGYVYQDIRNKKISKLYFDSQMEALQEYKKIIDENKIDCDFKEVYSFLYTIKDKEKLKKYYELLIKLGIEVEFQENQKMLGFDVKAAIKIENQAIFHPIKFLMNLKKDFEIIENTRIIDIDTKNNILYTGKAKIFAKKIIIATNYPIIDIPGFYFTKMYKSQSYTVSLTDTEDIKASYQSDSENGITYRSFNDDLIIGGLDHRAGRINNNDKYKRLEEKAKITFPESRITNKWTADDCITFDGIPFVGYFSKSRRDIFVITGFNKWGMANAMIGSDLIRDLLLQKNNKYQKLFSPQRKRICITSFFSNMLTNIKYIMFKHLTKPTNTVKDLQRGTGDIVIYKGEKKAVFKDKNGKLFVCSPYCEHLKCQLIFNQNAKTWDCPCHGSRYDIYGNIIVGPTVKNLQNTVEENE